MNDATGILKTAAQQIAARLVVWRERAGLTQEGAARLLGESIHTYRQWEYARRLPNWRAREAIKKAIAETEARLASESQGKRLGVDHKGQWTAAQYAIDAGWGWEGVEATARLGVAEEDAEGLSEGEREALVEYCRGRVSEAQASETTTTNEQTL